MNMSNARHLMYRSHKHGHTYVAGSSVLKAHLSEDSDES